MRFRRFDYAISYALERLMSEGELVEVERWQGHDAGGDPSLATREVLNHHLEVPMSRSYLGDPRHLIDILAEEIKPNREWADEHFAERVGGVPLNPDPSYERWPWWRGQDSSKQAGEQFTHTYSERFWPKTAFENEPTEFTDRHSLRILKGIRYEYGDLSDVVDLLSVEPFTRQAYLPIFFPEDTGCVHRGRIPCTLGYHFMRRDNRLHLWYHIRSCDAVRHFRDDLYLAVKLALWMLDTLTEIEESWQLVTPGNLYFTAYSFHVHRGDEHRVF